MKVLLHICCGPCAIMPVRRLQEEGHTVTGYFYNPNIHPLAEYLRRREGAALVAERCKIDMIWAVRPEDYNTAAWLRGLRGCLDAPERCGLCLGLRLEAAFRQALAGGFEAFSTSLLYSRHQPHEFIAGRGAALAGATAPAAALQPPSGSAAFLYRDFRPDWQAGIDLSKDWSIYRQQYCGCVFSENERYARALKKSNSLLAEQPEQLH